jgi:hypothetical protein
MIFDCHARTIPQLLSAVNKKSIDSVNELRYLQSTAHGGRMEMDIESTHCRSCLVPILSGTHGAVCSLCWDRVVAGELTLYMGPPTKREVSLEMIARIPARRKIDRMLAAAGR